MSGEDIKNVIGEGHGETDAVDEKETRIEPAGDGTSYPAPEEDEEAIRERETERARQQQDEKDSYTPGGQ